MRCFRRLVFGVNSLTAVDTLVASVAEVVDREEFSLAGKALSPELGSIFSVQLQTRAKNIVKYQGSTYSPNFESKTIALNISLPISG